MKRNKYRGRLQGYYKRIQNALVDTIRYIHVPWTQVPGKLLEHLNESLREYTYIYSTNYDLLIDRAIRRNADGIKDYFWRTDGLFRLGNTRVVDASNVVLYLHGGLHLYGVSGGGSWKQLREEYSNLLEQFDYPIDAAYPLVITEGSHEDKVRSISGSEYSSFAHQKFAQHQGSLVVFGHSLGENDEHLVQVINQWNDPIIAISMRPSTEDDIKAKKRRYKARLQQSTTFFSSTRKHTPWAAHL